MTRRCTLQPSDEAVARRFSQVDDLLSDHAKARGDSGVVEWQRLPELRQFRQREFERRSDLPDRRGACAREEGGNATSLLVAQVQEQRAALSHRQLAQFVPEVAQILAVKQGRDDRGPSIRQLVHGDAVTAPQGCVRIVNVEQVGDDPRQIV